jgi:hypothetical protein
MADISKCKGTGCPIKETCYRYLAPSNDFWQAYLTEVPYNHAADSCDHYWEMYSQKQKGDGKHETKDITRS